MKTLVTTCALIGAVALGSTPAWSSTYCHNQALAYANSQANPVAGGVAGGVIGGVAGVVAGSILGKGKNAKIAGGLIGGGVGAAAGASSQKKKRDQIYQQAYQECIKQAVPANYTVPPVGSPDWTYQCDLKYKSFVANPEDPKYGTFQPLALADGTYPPRRLCSLP